MLRNGWCLCLQRATPIARFRIGRCLATFVALGTACDFMRDPLRPELEARLSVHAVLLAGDTLARVLVNRVNEVQGEWATVPIENASVMLIQGTNTLRLSTQVPGKCFASPSGDNSAAERGCYKARVAGGLRAGTTYSLHVDAGADGRAQGSTTLPREFDITAPAAGARIISTRSDTTAPSFTVRWTGATATSFVEVLLRPATPDCSIYIAGESEARTSRLGTVDGDSVRLQIHDFACTFPPAGLPGELTVITYDSVYGQYIHDIRSGTTPAPRASAGVNGAVGLFASAVRRTLPIVLTGDKSGGQQ